jgi:hypothetical protein
VLDNADIGAVVVHVGDTTVANEMATASTVDVGFHYELSDHARDHIRNERSASAGRAAVAGRLRAGCPLILPRPYLLPTIARSSSV